VCAVGLHHKAILRTGRKTVLMFGLATLSASTIGFGMSKNIPSWCITRVLQGIGSAAAGKYHHHHHQLWWHQHQFSLVASSDSTNNYLDLC